MSREERLKRVVLEGHFESRTELQMLELSDIKPRAHGSFRPLNELHVEELFDSIAAVGLLEPLVVDRCRRMLAGEHRLEAIRRLVVHDRWSGPVPVRVLADLDAAANPGGARLVELAENEKRLDYTPAEVRDLARWLASQGYRCRDGRPPHGSRPLMPALEAIVGKSRRRIQQILKGSRPETTKHFAVLVRRLDRAARELEEALAGDRRRDAAEVRRALEELRGRLAALRARR